MAPRAPFLSAGAAYVYILYVIGPTIVEFSSRKVTTRPPLFSTVKRNDIHFFPRDLRAHAIFRRLSQGILSRANGSDMIIETDNRERETETRDRDSVPRDGPMVAPMLAFKLAMWIIISSGREKRITIETERESCQV